MKQQTSITVHHCRPRKTNFRFPFAENNRKFAVSIFHINIYIHIYIYISRSISVYQSIYSYTYASTAVSNGKQKMEALAIFLNPLLFSHHANRSLLFVLLFMKKQTKVACLQTD
jgi:hypothetical protein